jgi:hypothetical protein
MAMSGDGEEEEEEVEEDDEDVLFVIFLDWKTALGFFKCQRL